MLPPEAVWVTEVHPVTAPEKVITGAGFTVILIAFELAVVQPLLA